MPTTYLIDPAGKVIAGDVGLVTRENLEDYISSKKAQNASARNETERDDS